MANRSHEELERLLDEALASYSDEEPRMGLEGRVLARVQADGRARRSLGWRWVAAVPVLAGLVLVVLGSRVHLPAARQPAAVALQTPRVVTEPVRSASSSGHRAVRLRPRPGQPALAKPDRFPLPAPLSEQDRALVDLVTRFPHQASAALGETERLTIKPIEIEKIQIPLLDSWSEQ
ncbi:MAG TPA: hypothetical protein VGH38_24155 [Bryobacteraceae bacterium]|jgi:hypothetical protein